MTVTVLGTGLMGAGMARSLSRAGLAVRAWNRGPEKARPLAADGIAVVEDVTAAVAEAGVVLTMLFDTNSVLDVMARALPAMRPDAIWVQAATVGLDGTRRLSELAEKHGITYVDAPVLGSRQPAERGELIVLVGGARDDRLTPVFDAIGSRTVWVGERPGDGHRLKLVANSWVLSVTAAVAQAVALARAQGVDPRSFLDVIAGGPLDSGYAQLKGAAMIDGNFAPAFGLAGAVKDSALIAAAMREAGVDPDVMDAVGQAFGRAADAGHGAEDMAAVLFAFATKENPPS